ncbi:MAG: hypothetical protein J6J01_07545 [Oscillospiraceae bacterium]|nr:hypothetical protein [Oscillospiraceae bacterium]MBR2319509.1 hypothetical protein [Clostridia bacterium]
MVTIAQAQQGIAAFIEKEIVPQLTGFEKIVVGAGGGLLTAKLPELMDKIADHPMLSVLDIYNKKTGEMDIDAIYNAVEPYIGAEPFSLKVPVVGITMKMGRQEIRELYDYIKRA